MTEPTTARPSLARWLPLLVVAALGVLLAAGVWMSRNPGRDALPSALIDRPAPEFSLPLLHEPGRMVTGQDLRGAPYLLNVWGSWCPECRVEHPVLTRFAETKRVRVIGYNLKDEHGEALRWLEQFGNPYWMVLVDPDGRAAIRVHQHHPVRVAELLQPAQRLAVLVLEVVADHAHALGLGEARQHRVFDPALRAPAAPDVEQVGRAAQVLTGDHAAGLVQQRQGEFRRRAVDERRGQGVAAGVAAHPDASGQQHAQRGHHQQRQPAREGRTGGRGLGHREGSGSVAIGLRKRRSVAVTKPPSIISSAPAQTQRTNGLTCTRSAQAPSPRGSPSAT